LAADSRSNQLANAANDLAFHEIAREDNTWIQQSQLEKNAKQKQVTGA
jgi:hypothetical protein